MIPNLFSKQPIPKPLPSLLLDQISKISKSTNQKDAVKLAFNFVTRHWGGNRMGLIIYFPRIFEKSIFRITATRGYMHCTTMNFLIRILLINSKIFNEADIQLRMTHTWYLLPHQYLRLKLKSGDTIYLDPWNFQFGIPFGSYGKGFDSTKLLSTFNSTNRR